MSSRARILLIVALVAALNVLGLVVICAVGFNRLSQELTTAWVEQYQVAYPFPAIQWPSEPVESIAVENAQPLDDYWRRLQQALSDRSEEGGVRQIGTLVLPSGTVFVTDINFVDENMPFRRTVRPGRYPVYEISQKLRVAAAVVFQKEKLPTQWVVADSFGDSERTFDDLVPRGSVGIDSTVIILDAIACQTQPMYDPWRLYDSPANGLVLDSVSGANVICVPSLGNVLVHAFWGLDDESRPVVLMVHDDM